MSQTQLQFFELLRSGLWGTPANEALFSESTNWKELFRLSKEQTVFGVVYDGIITLPQNLRPPRPILLNWYAQVNCIETLNRKQNETLVKIYTLYREQGFTPVLLKGQGVASCYRNPLRRNCGDIDLLVGEADYEQVNAYVKKEKIAKQYEESNNHLEFCFEKQIIENHIECIKLFRKKDQDYLRKITSSWFPLSKEVCIINQQKIMLPPVEFNAIFLLLHIVVHFFREGIGIRQLCDWSRYIFTHEFNLEVLKTHIQTFHLEELWSIFGELIIEYLGLPREKFPFQKQGYKKQLNKTIKHIIISGNFGHYNALWKGRPASYWDGKLFAFKNEIKRLQFLFQISPQDTASYLIFFIRQGIKQVLKDKNLNV